MTVKAVPVSRKGCELSKRAHSNIMTGTIGTTSKTNPKRKSAKLLYTRTTETTLSCQAMRCIILVKCHVKFELTGKLALEVRLPSPHFRPEHVVSKYFLRLSCLRVGLVLPPTL